MNLGFCVIHKMRSKTVLYYIYLYIYYLFPSQYGNREEHSHLVCYHWLQLTVIPSGTSSSSERFGYFHASLLQRRASVPLSRVRILLSRAALLLQRAAGWVMNNTEKQCAIAPCHCGLVAGFQVTSSFPCEPKPDVILLLLP